MKVGDLVQSNWTTSPFIGVVIESRFGQAYVFWLTNKHTEWIYAEDLEIISESR